MACPARGLSGWIHHLRAGWGAKRRDRAKTETFMMVDKEVV
jgi:hypothetical protein